MLDNTIGMVNQLRTMAHAINTTNTRLPADRKIKRNFRENFTPLAA